MKKTRPSKFEYFFCLLIQTSFKQSMMTLADHINSTHTHTHTHTRARQEAWVVHRKPQGGSAAKGAPPNCQLAIIRHGSADAAVPANVETRALASEACLPQLVPLIAAAALLEKPVHSAAGRFEMAADCIHDLNQAQIV